MYHIIAPCPRDADSVEAGLFIDSDTFKRQMGELAAQGVQSLTLDQYASAIKGGVRPSKRLLLTFDDAYAHVDAAVRPTLAHHGFTAVMFANWAHLGGLNAWDSHHPNLAKLEIASKELLKEMAAGPWEIASHGLRHEDLRGVDRQQRLAELIECRERLSDLVKKPVVDLAYPYGYCDSELQEDVLLAGYRMAFGAAVTSSSDPLQLPRRPVSGKDSLRTFRLKTSRWANGLYRVHRLAPRWARYAVHHFIGEAAR
jgi:peptidoglycan/xylan/chitin deacetylase (PgdA/CDA1 family)